MSILLVCFSFSLRRDPSPPLFPYTTLFRSRPHSRSSVSLARPSGPSGASRRHGRNRGTEGEGSPAPAHRMHGRSGPSKHGRSEEHTSELQSRGHIVCRLLLEKKKQDIAQERSLHTTQRLA